MSLKSRIFSARARYNSEHKDAHHGSIIGIERDVSNRKYNTTEVDNAIHEGLLQRGQNQAVYVQL